MLRLRESVGYMAGSRACRMGGRSILGIQQQVNVHYSHWCDARWRRDYGAQWVAAQFPLPSFFGWWGVFASHHGGIGSCPPTKPMEWL